MWAPPHHIQVYANMVAQDGADDARKTKRKIKGSGFEPCDISPISEDGDRMLSQVDNGLLSHT